MQPTVCAFSLPTIIFQKHVRNMESHEKFELQGEYS